MPLFKRNGLVCHGCRLEYDGTRFSVFNLDFCSRTCLTPIMKARADEEETYRVAQLEKQRMRGRAIDFDEGKGDPL